MSVTTTADECRARANEKLVEARKLLKEAQEDMENMIDPETWGGSEWSESFIQEAEEAIAECLKIRNELRKISNKI